MKEQVGDLLKELRKRAGFSSINALAAHLDVQVNTVGDIERGDNWISPEMLPALSRALNVPPAALYPGFGKSVTPTPAEALAVLAKAIESSKPPLIVVEPAKEIIPASSDPDQAAVIAALAAMDEKEFRKWKAVLRPMLLDRDKGQKIVKVRDKA